MPPNFLIGWRKIKPTIWTEIGRNQLDRRDKGQACSAYLLFLRVSGYDLDRTSHRLFAICIHGEKL